MDEALQGFIRLSMVSPFEQRFFHSTKGHRKRLADPAFGTLSICPQGFQHYLKFEFRTVMLTVSTRQSKRATVYRRSISIILMIRTILYPFQSFQLLALRVQPVKV